MTILVPPPKKGIVAKPKQVYGKKMRPKVVRTRRQTCEIERAMKQAKKNGIPFLAKCF